ncbi:golgi/lysosome glycoprotein [Trypanosoma theileri]|uniref:Golgi/lysosome glycoprotein n=1 Tax=Trypanosoma theileri TaxID=67003 RepID=A0A1X0NKD5_9TRYP|nr:golgi/lysosome glycoprotein [Trypanosoma theileri]ORC85146.1 golgi/lysosome glycoprotein [Trypanosoma theileri]
MKLILVFLISLLSFCCSLVHGSSLYPSCEGQEVQGSAGAGGEVTIHEIPKKLKNLTLTCLVYEVTSLTGGLNRDGWDPCSVPHQTEYLHRLVLRAKEKNKLTGNYDVTDYDVKDMAGGSLGDISIRLPEAGHFSLVFMNKGENPRCSLQIRAIMNYMESAKESQDAYLPVVVSVVPRAVYIRRTSTTKFILRYPKGTNMHKAKNDIVTLKGLDKECADNTSEGIGMRLPSVKSDFHSFEDPSTLGERDYFFDTPETYRICYRAKGDALSTELAVVRVFDGNPSYYQIVEGQDKDGRVLVGVKTTIKFHGFDLDTRPEGDRAKFVRDSEDCATASPAGGVPESTDLGPSDDYGPSTTYTLWSWVLRQGGAFKICYKRRHGIWTEVPSVTDLGYSAAGPPTTTAPGDSNSPAVIPQPTDPITKKACPMAQENTRENPWVSYEAIRMTLNTTKLPDDFLKKVSQSFCIPRAALAVTHITHNMEKRQVVYISILCEDLGETRPCDTMERQNYILSLGKENSSILTDLSIASVKGINSLFAFGDDPLFTKGNGDRTVVVLLACLTVIMVTGMIVFGMVKYRENRQYFVQFGTDDDEVADMYENDMPVGRGGTTGRSAIKNAVIEVED